MQRAEPEKKRSLELGSKNKPEPKPMKNIVWKTTSVERATEHGIKRDIKNILTV